MKMDTKRKWPVAALSLLGMASTMSAARIQEGNGAHCAPTPPATCYPEDCKRCYCLGPDNYGVNAPVRPRTCNGDWVIEVAGFYWNSHQDGMEYAINNKVQFPNDNPDESGIVDAGLNTLVDASFVNPDFKWDFGFKVGLGYNTTCDGWDFGVEWTWYRGKANNTSESETSDNTTILPIWSAFAPKQGLTLYASDVESNWKLELNMIDIELGREFWTSKYLTMRPFVGLRIAYIDQTFQIDHKGGSWTSNSSAKGSQNTANNYVSINNDFHGVGVRGGFDTLWNLGCGWGIYGNIAYSILYGRFDIKHDETNREATSPHSKTKIADAKGHFRASRAVADLGIGLQYQTMFCDCAYGFAAMLGWEHHVFFDQNQMWRVVRIGDTFGGAGSTAAPTFNNTGENVYSQRRGDLDTQGWTLKVRFEF